MKKTCSRCKRTLPKENFNKCNVTPDGLQYYCKDCQRAYRKGQSSIVVIQQNRQVEYSNISNA